MHNDRNIIIEADGYQLVQYASGESRIEHPASGTCSIWLHHEEEAEIKADPSVMSRWPLDEDMGEEETEEDHAGPADNPGALRIRIHVNEDNLGDLSGFDREASLRRYCDQLRDAVAREFPGAEIRIKTGGYSPTPYVAYSEGVEDLEAVEHRLLDLANEVFAANNWQVDEE